MKYFVLIMFFFSSSAFAQLDPSSSRLLMQGSSDQSLDSSRYQMRPKTQGETRSVQRVRSVPKPSEPAPTSKPAHVKPKPPKEVKPVPVKIVEVEPKEEKRIHISDPRLNLVEVNFAPGVMYINSNSQTWYRDYFSFSPSIDVDAKIWITPSLAVKAGYGTSLAADITSAPTGLSKTATEHRSFSGGFEFRNFASASRKSLSYAFGLGYSDYQMIVPRTSTDRIRLKTKGAVLSLSTRIPLSLSEARFLSIDILPQLKTAEESTQVSFKSGKLDSAHGIRLSVGGEYVIDRKQQFYWKLSHRVDKHVYEGASSANDPITGTTLSGISVTTGTTQFQFGFSWGD